MNKIRKGKMKEFSSESESDDEDAKLLKMVSSASKGSANKANKKFSPERNNDPSS
jgi:hypothetical protein